MSSSRRNLVQRGQKYPSPAGTTAFVVLRLLDPFLQYGILALGVGAPLLTRLGFKTIADGPPAQTGIGFIDALELSPYRLVLLGMGIGCTVKKIFWLLYISKEAFPLTTAIPVAVMSNVNNTIISLLATTTLSGSLSGALTKPNVVFGLGLYVVGIFTEAISEVQRKFYKDDPRNEGKLYTEGLWSITRHINYTGFSAWRTGYALVGVGWVAGGLVGFLNVRDFVKRAIPSMDTYVSRKYGEQWENYKKKVPYRIIPGLL